MLRSIGKKIKKIRVCKEKVIIYFFDKTKLDVSHDTYSSFYLFANKVLTPEELKEIEDLNNISFLFNEALKMLKKSVMSEQKIREKLLLKTKNRKRVESVIKSLKEHDLIDDKAYVADFLIYAEEKKMGKYKIVNELIKRGIKAEIAKKLVFKEKNELEKALSLLPSLERKYDSRNYQAKREAIYNYLLTHGYSNEIAYNVLGKVKRNEKRENEVIKNDFERAYQKFEFKFEGRQLFEKISDYLRKKGYKYSDIKKIWEEKNYENN